MQPKRFFLIRRIAAKEVSLFFTAPIAYLFLASFAAITLFIFFWVETFFSRNIADVRPLFEWMPILLIFLSAALTMRLWSEERRTGTLEHILTQPVPLWYFVVGKFFGCLTLLIIALLITLPLPLTVMLMGELDWGPVWAGYIASLLLGAAYISIGLFASARSENQVVSLINATILCGIFYLIGTGVITDFFGNQAGEWLRLLSTAARFDSITRGVIDLRDLYYYCSIIIVFLTLNTNTLEKERWATMKDTPHHRTWRTITLLLLANTLAVNLWLGQLGTARIDSTEGKQYSISETTRGYLKKLQEPLLIRGYFSGKTHPLLSPLVPQLRNLIEEYAVAGDGKIRVEFVDPLKAPDLEKEANQKYGIQPVPFQVEDRYQSAIVSSYFNVLIQYGSEYQVLTFRDLIEINVKNEMDIAVLLRNPEYDLTRAIKKVLHSYQAGGDLFQTIKGTLTFKAYISPDTALPSQLVKYRKVIEESINKMQDKFGDRLQAQFIDPTADGGQVAQQIEQDYGFQPMTVSLLSDQGFYFHLVLTKDGQLIQIPIGNLTEEDFERNLQTGIKRFAHGFTKTVALTLPESTADTEFAPISNRFSELKRFLGSELNVQWEDLSDGHVSGEADILLLVAPRNLDKKQLFAIDQFLMQGGTIIAATSPYSVYLQDRNLSIVKQESGLSDWLAHHGLKLEEKLVMDPKNAAFPVPVTRNINGFQLQEIRMLDYPYFIDIRGPGLNRKNMITAELPQVILAWGSPILIDTEKQANRTITELLRSSEDAWLSSSTDIMPHIDEQGLSLFKPEGETAKHLLGVISAGVFDSYFAGKPSPLLEEPARKSTDDSVTNKRPDIISGIIGHSPQSARIILFSSSDFLDDQILQLMGTARRSKYLDSLQLIANTIDWSLEDIGLMSIRARGHFNRTLHPMKQDARLLWEYLNYALAAITLGFIALIQRRRQKDWCYHYTQKLLRQSDT